MIHGSFANLILLTLMVILFGVLLRGRRRLYKSYWLAGWIFTLVSYALWAAPNYTPAFMVFANRTRYDVGLFGAVTFLLSFLIDHAPLRRVFRVTLPLVLLVCAVSQLEGFFSTHLALLRALTILTLLATLAGGNLLLPRQWTGRRIALLLIASLTALAAFAFTFYGGGNDPVIFLCDLTRSGVLLACGVLFVGEIGWTLSGISALVGFSAWAAMFYYGILGNLNNWDFALFEELYNVPKYFVGVGMIVKLFEETHAHLEQQAGQYRELYEDFRVLFDAYPHAMWIADPATGRFVAANPAAIASYGFDEREMLTLRLADLDFADPSEQKSDLGAVVPLDTHDGRPTRHQHKDGSELWVELVDRGIAYQGSRARFVMARDITESMRLNQELLHRANHDALTGLPNRVLLHQRMEQRLTECARDGRKMLVLTLDIDYFKQINDTHGHLIGDECLVLIAQRLRGSLREADTIGRTGGEEFVAIVGSLRSIDEAQLVTNALLNLFHEPFVLANGEVLSLKISIGAAVFPDDATEIDALRQQSDQALYRAKRNGRNRAEFAAPLSV